MPTDRFPVTRAILSRTQVRLDKAVVGPNAGLRINTPVLVIAGGRNRGIVLRRGELTLPHQGRTDIGACAIEAHRLREHSTWFHDFAPVGCAGGTWMPAAWRIARRSATRAIWILYPFRPKPRAGCKAAVAAADATCSSMAFPVRAASACFDLHGVGATWPKTIDAVATFFRLATMETVAVATGQSNPCFCRTS